MLIHLILWVNHKRPAAALRHQDPILGRDSVTRQTLCVPLADDIWVTQDVDKAEAGTDGNVQFLALYYPLVNKLRKKGKYALCTMCTISPF